MYKLVSAMAWGEGYSRLRFQAAYLLFFLIIVVGNLPGARADLGHLASGLTLHSMAYSIITYLLFSGSAGTLARRTIIAVLTVAIMGAIDEFVQSFFPYRGAAVSDWAVDVAASLCTSVLLRYFYSRTKR